MLFSPLRRLALAGLAAAAFGFGALPAQAQAPAFSPDQRKAVVELIRRRC